jgi:hypothetical protein
MALTVGSAQIAATRADAALTTISNRLPRKRSMTCNTDEGPPTRTTAMRTAASMGAYVSGRSFAAPDVRILSSHRARGMWGLSAYYRPACNFLQIQPSLARLGGERQLPGSLPRDRWCKA